MLQQAACLRAPAPLSSPPALRCRQQIRQQRRPVAVRAEQQQEPGTPQEAASGDTCPTCGVPLSSKAFGCDTTGRIAGGIGAVPGFKWWPIKAYRPCPKLAEAGLAYQRKGQITDEVLFGKGRR
ncbi:hypothetical protein D9Q98_005341 [Chlorella vulgaris]|uniref:Uncharacterized protein n=1 Tax=Chlorella vulgaris TaxID=3077 RepID=A0A9D4TM20_CHLVU|nr:hypothetical protein D9Q98_005341 [Chlorella vulgaris]